jgi:hypothetical protein
VRHPVDLALSVTPQADGDPAAKIEDVEGPGTQT